MIHSYKSYLYYLAQDKIALGVVGRRPRLFRDEIWRFEIRLRRAEYADACCRHNKLE